MESMDANDCNGKTAILAPLSIITMVFHIIFRYPCTFVLSNAEVILTAFVSRNQ